MHSATIYQVFQLSSGQLPIPVQAVDKMVDHIISAGIHPVVFRCGRGIAEMILAVIDHIPWTVDFCISKPIAIVPFLHNVIMGFNSIVFQHFSNFCICKSKILIKIRICYGIDIKVIKACKNAFLCNAKTSGQHGEFQAVIGFQSIPQQVSDQKHHLVIIAIFIGLGKGDIIFINQYNHFFSVMQFQKF